MLGNPLRQAWMGLRYLLRRDGPMAAWTTTGMRLQGLICRSIGPM